ncbi:hypothetical protein [Aggregatibacter kilianii]|uniref:hypothetical protein n=1 Tax=Aggregatibacter kilianii TaxID=2025884 RepID=UPI000D641F44|nr:hypothetical protein [Aggregatibacter kilianii]
MKRFLNYVFYFTWKLHRTIGINFIEKPTKYILNFIPFFNKNLKKREKYYRNIMDNPEYGLDIGFSFYCMLTTGTILSSCLLFFFVTLFGISINNKHKLYTFTIVALVISYTINEILLGWHKKNYIKLFKEFEKSNKKYKGYITALCYHLGTIILAISIILFIQQY